MGALKLNRFLHTCKQNFCVTKILRIHLFLRYHIKGTVLTGFFTNINLNWILCRVLLHEIQHAIGIGHTHQRPDRDDYVDVKFDNVKSDAQQFFKKSKWIKTHNVAYNGRSMMHYTFKGGAFAIDNSKPTIVSKVCYILHTGWTKAIFSRASLFSLYFFLSFSSTHF